MFVVTQATMGHPGRVLLVTQEVVLTGVTMVLGNINPTLVVRLLMLLVQQALTIIVIGAVEVMEAMLEIAFPVIRVVALIAVTMGRGSIYLILAVQLLILLAQRVPTVIVFGAIPATMAHLELVVLGIQVVVPTDVTMDPGSINPILVV